MIVWTDWVETSKRHRMAKHKALSDMQLLIMFWDDVLTWDYYRVHITYLELLDIGLVLTKTIIIILFSLKALLSTTSGVVPSCLTSTLMKWPHPLRTQSDHEWADPHSKNSGTRQHQPWISSWWRTEARISQAWPACHTLEKHTS